MIPRERIEELAFQALERTEYNMNPPEWRAHRKIKEAITQALEEARMAVEGEFICPKCGIRHVCKTNNEAPF